MYENSWVRKWVLGNIPTPPLTPPEEPVITTCPCCKARLGGVLCSTCRAGYAVCERCGDLSNDIESVDSSEPEVGYRGSMPLCGTCRSLLGTAAFFAGYCGSTPLPNIGIQTPVITEEEVGF